ncbi:hypothetical protein P43SY_003209 [Pythium insidiosum]|uniref:Uncharacterized protein n=1 Tax=Pythium insidiosum TaxID=114742 RepID=A0AAD5Q8G6_PYTIN|nr:hypothetical protein P43SY_003209 [Pythium insidiosum]
MEFVRKNLRAAQQRQAKYYNRGRQDVRFERGELDYVDSRVLSSELGQPDYDPHRDYVRNKMPPKWYEPFPVKQRLKESLDVQEIFRGRQITKSAPRLYVDDQLVYAIKDLLAPQGQEDRLQPLSTHIISDKFASSKIKAMGGTWTIEQVASVLDECLWRSWFFGPGAEPEHYFNPFVALDDARKNVLYAYIRGWLVQQEQEEENEFEVEGEINTARTWNVRKVLDSFRQENKTYFLVDWEPTLEPRANIPSTVIAALYRERRALVRRTYIDDEATEE